MREDPLVSFTAFVEAAWGRHVRLALLLCGDPHRAEDLLQDCLVALYRRWGRMDTARDPHAYLRRMLVHRNVSRWRRERRETLTAQAPEVADPRAGMVEPHEQLRRALMALPTRQRAVVVLRYYLDMSERQVAEELGCTVGTVKTHHSRAMTRLRELLPDFTLSAKEATTQCCSTSRG
jgi:RNA polymerase sigma-70 factor (sigma-E family)